MNKLLYLLFFIPIIVMADNYSIEGQWEDTTPISVFYSPQYSVEIRVNGENPSSLSGLLSPEFSAFITASPNDVVEARVINCNVISGGNLCSGWSQWVQAVIENEPITPNSPVNLIITIKPV
jgi:hypothetical protein